jgi:HPt (histidine-containing phosphotransfer) domain-containing protein
MTRPLQGDARPREGAGPALASGFDRARALFAARIEEQIIRIEQCRLDLLSGRSPGRAALDEIEAHAHKISGVAETVGCPRAGRLAAGVERLIGQGRREGLSDRAILQAIEPALEALLDALEAVLEP